MRTPGFTADASLYKKRDTYRVSEESAAPGGPLQVVPQLGFGFGGGIGVTGPADPEETCYYCISYIRVPCGLV